MTDTTIKQYIAATELLDRDTSVSASVKTITLDRAVIEYSCARQQYRGIAAAFFGSMLAVGAAIYNPNLSQAYRLGGIVGSALVATGSGVLFARTRKLHLRARSEIESIANELTNKEREGFQASDPSIPTTIPAGMTLNATVTKYS